MQEHDAFFDENEEVNFYGRALFLKLKIVKSIWRESSVYGLEMLWVDKYRPVQLDRLSFHGDLTSQLRRMASKESVGNMSHLMFYGPAGKKTRVMALLREVGL